MSEAWKNIDLEGSGLQTANMRLARLLKKRAVAYALLAVFPLGLHRDYLQSQGPAWAYRAATVTALGLLWYGMPWPASALLLGLLIAAAVDIRWIDTRIASINKQLRMAVLKSTGTAPPPGYRGRYTDDAPAAADHLAEYIRVKERERGGHRPIDPAETPDPKSDAPRRAPSFAEQEAMLRELYKSKKKD